MDAAEFEAADLTIRASDAPDRRVDPALAEQGVSLGRDARRRRVGCSWRLGSGRYDREARRTVDSSRPRPGLSVRPAPEVWWLPVSISRRIIATQTSERSTVALGAQSSGEERR